MPVEPIHDIDLKDMVKENLELTKEIHHMTRKIKRYITFQKVLSVVYLTLIIAPIILSIIFLPPIIKNFVAEYQGLLGGSSSGLLDILQGGGWNLDALKSINPQEAAPQDINFNDIQKLSPEAKNILLQQLQKK